MNSSLRGRRRSRGFTPVCFMILLLNCPLLTRAADEPKSTAPKSPAVSPKEKAPAARPARPASEPVALVTGSRIPQKVSRLGAVPTTSARVTILTGEQLARTGSSTVAGALSRSGYR